MASADQTTPTIEPPKDYRDRYEQRTGVSFRLCPVCHRGRMIRIELPHRRLHNPNLQGYIMRNARLSTAISAHLPRQVRGEVSLRRAPNLPSLFRSRSAPHRSSLFGHPILRHNSFRHRIICCFGFWFCHQRPHDSIPSAGCIEPG